MQLGTILVTAINAVCPIILLILLGYILKSKKFITKEFVKLSYFYNRKDRGSIAIQSGVGISQCCDEDEFLGYLVFLDVLTTKFAEAVIHIEEISQEEYQRKLKNGMNQKNM